MSPSTTTSDVSGGAMYGQPNYNAIDKAVTTDSLRLISKSDNVFTWLGPNVVLAFFFVVVLVTVLSMGWYLNDDVTEGWVAFWAWSTAVLALVLFYLYFMMVTGTGSFVTSHRKKQ